MKAQGTAMGGLAPDPKVQAFSFMLASALVPYLKANAAPTVTVSTGGLQTSTTPATPTAAPASAQTIPGTLI